MRKEREWHTRKEMIALGYPKVVVDRIIHSIYGDACTRRSGTGRTSKFIIDRIEFEKIWRHSFQDCV